MRVNAPTAIESSSNTPACSDHWAHTDGDGYGNVCDPLAAA